LTFDEEGMAVCDETGERYKIKNQIVTIIS
jgi:hypothetical protein